MNSRIEFSYNSCCLKNKVKLLYLNLGYKKNPLFIKKVLNLINLKFKNGD